MDALNRARTDAHEAARGELWRERALAALPVPGWLEGGATSGDVALSTRARVMRNLRGYPFPARLDGPGAVAVMDEVLRAAGTDLTVRASISAPERDFLVGARLLSVEYPHAMPGRAFGLDGGRCLALMVNEEDHIRLQALTPGASLDRALSLAGDRLHTLGQGLDFARHDDWGYLASSVYNCGEGLRLSALLALIGLATAGRMGEVLPALRASGLVFRGLFGESSRAVGAFAQVSTLTGGAGAFGGAVAYLVERERAARAELPREALRVRTTEALALIAETPRLGMADAVRALGWLRWGAVEGLVPLGITAVDYALSTTEFRAHVAPTDESRAANLRRDLGL